MCTTARPFYTPIYVTISEFFKKIFSRLLLGNCLGLVVATLVLVIGSEGHGMTRLVKEQCDFIVSLPMVGRINSLNASVAGSILMYEALRQRTATK